MGIAPKIRLAGIIALCGVLCSCTDEPVAHNIDQFQANKIAAILSNEGVEARIKKETGAQGKYSVYIKESDLSQAVGIIDRKELLKEKGDSFAELTEPKGIIPNSREVEALRLDRALAVELENAINNIPKVGSAKAVVRVNFQKDDKVPSVALIIRGRALEDRDREAAHQIVKQTIPGIPEESIFVTVYTDDKAQDTKLGVEGIISDNGVPVRIPLRDFFYRWRVAADDYNGLAISILIFLGFVGIVCVVIGYWAGARKSRVEYEPELLNTKSKQLKLDRTNKGITEL